MADRAAAEHLAAADPVLAGLIEELGELSLETRRQRHPPADAYGLLLRSVIAQQVSVKAAATIHGRLLDLFAGAPPDPAALLALAPERLREAGLSGRKVEYLRGLSEQVLCGALELDGLERLSDEQVITEITSVRGLGVWSAEIFLIHHLERPDVLPSGDLGLRRAAERVYGLERLPTPDRLTAIAEPWRPHRSLASIYLWESLRGAPG